MEFAMMAQPTPNLILLQRTDSVENPLVLIMPNTSLIYLYLNTLDTHVDT